jgi:hypothetical protein
MKPRTYVLIATLIGLIVAIVQLATAFMEMSSYTRLTKQYEEFTEEVAQKVVENFNKRSDLPDVDRPVIIARANGPNLEIEAGYDLRIDSQAAQYADGSGSMDTLISDYGPGKYKLADAPNAEVTVAVLKQTIDSFLGERVKGSSIQTEVLGGADGLPVRPGAIYSGDLGPIVGVPYFSYDTQSWKQMTLLPGTSPKTNESIAFLRALDVCRSISDVETLQRSEMKISTSTTTKVGGMHRKVIVRITVTNALQKEYSELSPLARYLFLKDSEKVSK